MLVGIIWMAETSRLRSWETRDLLEYSMNKRGPTCVNDWNPSICQRNSDCCEDYRCIFTSNGGIGIVSGNSMGYGNTGSASSICVSCLLDACNHDSNCCSGYRCVSSNDNIGSDIQIPVSRCFPSGTHCNETRYVVWI